MDSVYYLNVVFKKTKELHVKVVKGNRSNWVVCVQVNFINKLPSTFIDKYIYIFNLNKSLSYLINKL